MLTKEPMFRSEEYLIWVRTLASVVSRTKGCVAHHIIGNGRTSTIRTHDVWAIPLTDLEHKDLHQHGWARWEASNGSQLGHAVTVVSRAISCGVIKIIDKALYDRQITFVSEPLYKYYLDTIIEMLFSGALVIDKKKALGKNNVF